MTEMQNRIAELTEIHGTHNALRVAMSEARDDVTEREQEPGPQGIEWDAADFLRAIHRR